MENTKTKIEDIIWLKIKCSISAQKEQVELRMNDKASAQTSAGSDKAWSAWERPCWEDGQDHTLAALPLHGREHQDTQCIPTGWLPCGGGWLGG